MNSFITFTQTCRTWECDFHVEMGLKDMLAIIKNTTIVGDEEKFEAIWSEAGLEWEKNFKGDYVFVVGLE